MNSISKPLLVFPSSPTTRSRPLPPFTACSLSPPSAVQRSPSTASSIVGRRLQCLGSRGGESSCLCVFPGDFLDTAMEVGAALNLQSCSWIGPVKVGRRSSDFLSLPNRSLDERSAFEVRFGDPRPTGASIRTGHAQLNVSCCYKKSKGSDNFHNSFDEALELKRKSEQVLPYLNGRCIYLVGMMGSGKSTVGKILSEVLRYSFFDSDKLVEQAVGLPSVAEIFKEYSEAFFRDNESKVLKDLSSMRRLVVATGGGAVIRPINWKYMKQGLTVWLDVPLEALARRIAAVGTASRPLLHQEPGDPYTKAFAKLTALSEERGEVYANADARVSLEYIADKKGHGDVCTLTPTDIAFEALIKIESYVSENAAVLKHRYIHG